MKQIKEQFQHLAEQGKLMFDEPLAPYNSFKIGGPADVLAKPDTQRDLISLLVYALQHEVPWFILGKGSNLLIGDRGIRGLVISMEGFNKITRDENYVSAFAGRSLKELCDFCQKEGLSGLEFACGIPGSVGGAVFMNAGAYEGEIKDVLYCSKCLSPSLESLQSSNPILHLNKEAHAFSYRHSALQDRGLIHLSSVFQLIVSDPEEIRATMDKWDAMRNEKQPMDMPSAGSVFKRPEGHFTGKLVDDCGLRGFRIGGAQVSNKHCGFIVNLGGATARDVRDLIQHVQRTVYERFKVRLEMEIRQVGEM
ncbi:MAG: UDP-N-acetylmuramate dehydrogenase [Candidatus Cloacimonetes bacterium]|jgi:UDP-N-acetylmuramate dehydrogenase|nr:UDP-N-acetylmuramate dehydrogenase [Candidatus Cloacimonadota bacterium]MDD2506575.1 UDP-N-acetylmuramate dehydrogenase [Candidatus Cloacimonadota bacterium]MDD4560174.1 UDP-N-acetylmuramate dehydrogenase [Candidatus Cloacimonadota bacterium]